MNKHKHNSKQATSANPVRIFAICFFVYWILTIGFYFLAGEQLHFRESRGNLDMPVADMGITEVVQGTVIEQVFLANIQRLESVSVQWGTYLRPNAGTVTMELIHASSGELLMSCSLDAASITEGQLLTMVAEEPIETAYNTPLVIRIYGDSLPGSAVSPLMASTVQNEGQALCVNGVETVGTLCFSASGEDYIWTGLHYWKFVAAFGAVLVSTFAVIIYRAKKGKRSYILNAFTAVGKYRFLIRQLVSRDFKTKYKRSVLGVLWSFLNPLLMMIVQYFVFSTIFKNDIPNYLAYLLLGIVTFNFFNESCGMALTSIVGNAGLITKVYMPKYIYPLSRVLSSVVNLLISFAPLIAVCIFTGVQFEKSAILSLFFFFCVIIFSLGIGMLLASSMVFFRDTQFLWGVLSTIWMYMTPVFYPVSILQVNFAHILEINPLYHFLTAIRMCILDGISPEPKLFLLCLAMAAGALIFGAVVFQRAQSKFALYL